ncbi:MAG: hypothetical protein KKE36_11995 [Actinobacteria bacterium]|nr:hypothetical protein [Actinomycetota bacterium]
MITGSRSGRSMGSTRTWPAALAAVLVLSACLASAPGACASTTFEFFNPTEGSIESGTVHIIIKCWDPAGLTRAVIDAGTQEGQITFSGLPTYAEATYDWDTVKEFNGTHTIAIHCWNGTGQVTDDGILVTVNNVGVPMIDFKEPGPNQVLDQSTGPVSVKARVTRGQGGGGVERISFSVDGSTLHSALYDPPADAVDYAYTWNMTGMRSGQHTLRIYAESELGKKSMSERTTYKLEAVRSRFYFAEGTTRGGFVTYLCIGNPDDVEACVIVDFMTTDSTQMKSYIVPALSRRTVDIGGAIGTGRDTCVTVTSDREVVVERPMYFDYRPNGTGGRAPGGGPGYDGGSDAMGATAPSPTWYFAEGTTRSGFDTYVCVENPQAEDAGMTIYYQVEGEGHRTRYNAVPALSRVTINVAEQIGRDKDFSMKLECDRAVVAERPMYFCYMGSGAANRYWTGGHVVMGITAPRAQYYFAEGATYGNFEEWLCLQNPNEFEITVDAIYMLDRGEVLQRSYPVNANQRRTISVGAEVGPDRDVSVTLSSTSGFVAERPMYFDYRGSRGYSYTGGHDVMGATHLTTSCYFAEGYTGPGFDQWFCILNPNDEDAEVTITYYLEGGGTVRKSHQAPARSRYTVYVNEDLGDGLSQSSLITSSLPIVAERPMYFLFQGQYSGGHDVVGFTPPTF